jgi:hypothetical protein
VRRTICVEHRRLPNTTTRISGGRSQSTVHIFVLFHKPFVLARLGISPHSCSCRLFQSCGKPSAITCPPKYLYYLFYTLHTMRINTRTSKTRLLTIISCPLTFQKRRVRRSNMVSILNSHVLVASSCNQKVLCGREHAPVGVQLPQRPSPRIALIAVTRGI